VLFSWRLAVLVAVLVFLALFAFRIVLGPREAAEVRDGVYADQASFENARKNYATGGKLAPGSAGQPIGDSQKYEKVATLTELTSDYETDRRSVDALVASHQGIVQLERAAGLTGRRALFLGIGVPPDRFDAFIEAAKAIGRNAQLEIVKNDKTNEYLRLRARRTTLEKARAALDALQVSGASIDERIKVQNRLTELEEQIQELAVSLGEFDSQNELCTVRLTLREQPTRAERSWQWRITEALEWATIRYALLGGGFICLIVAGWLAALLARFVQRLAVSLQAPP
jgi:hypothetical protein